MNKMPIQKLYYSIKDVSDLVGVKQHVLRYWESEFAELKPSKNRAGNRTYRSRDIKIIFLIKQLLYDEKYTIDGARQKIGEILKDETKLDEMTITEPNPQARKILEEIRSELQQLSRLVEEEV